MRRIGKMTAGVLAGTLCFVSVAGNLYRSQAQGGQSSSQRENAPAQVGDRVEAAPAIGGEMRPEEKTVRDVYARLMRYHTAALDEASASLGVVHKAGDYMTIGVNNLRTGFMDEIFGRPLSELVTPRGGEVINLKPNYLRGADGRQEMPTAAIFDSRTPQSTVESGVRARSDICASFNYPRAQLHRLPDRASELPELSQSRRPVDNFPGWRSMFCPRPIPIRSACGRIRSSICRRA
jgi:hypothetical protein